MKTILKFFAVTIATLAFASCDLITNLPDNTEEPGDGQVDVELNQNINFAVSVSEVTAESAKAKIYHDGRATDTWYGFLTTEKDVTSAISAKHIELTKEGTISGLHSESRFTDELTGLTPETAYTYIVFGITADGQLYGKPFSTTFTTKKGETKMYVNPAWTVTYGGQKEYEGNIFDWISVNSTDNNKYFIAAYPKAAYDQYGIKAIAEAELASWKEVVAEAQKDPNYASMTLDFLLYQGSQEEPFNLFTPGEWYGIAYGVGADEELTGAYAISEVITISEEDPTPEYSAWIGDWKFTGANNVAWDLTISKGVNNEYFFLSGWEGTEEVNGTVVNISEGLEIPMYWNREYNVWEIYNTQLASMDFGAGYGNGIIWILGCNSDYQFVPVEEMPICFGSVTDAGTKEIIGYEVKMDEEGKEIFNNAYMSYMVDFEKEVDGYKYWAWSNCREWPTFPITVTPGTKTKTTVSTEGNKLKGAKSAVKVQTARTFTKTDRRFFPISTDLVLR